jgi:hypothetical protein
MGQPPPQTVSGYDTLPRQDAGGNDITNINTNDINVCRDDCNNRPSCRGFNFNGNTCWIKNNVNNKGDTNNWNLYVKKGCTSDDSGWAPKNVGVGEKTSKACPAGGNETATCGSDGNWTSFSGCPKIESKVESKSASNSDSDSVSSASDNTMLYMGLSGASCCCFIFIIVIIFIMKKKN